MKNIGEDGWNGGDSGDIGDTHDIKPLAYQQETPRSAASVQRNHLWWSEAWTFEIVLRRIKISATSCPSG
ncbi:hypothetical protein GN958_ATG23291 [Phytophthora infestans]|uniref:Uncharacterized protein n=1 Tax=Phytophthora infestans TaxID=4787 RepID=A0A8S9TG72_PHYIN|nr:hypothetical protein GN958_ATG23291 [Phytophthora infestans]